MREQAGKASNDFIFFRRGASRPSTARVSEPPLAWTEAITRIADSGIEDDLYAEVRRHLDEKEVTDLTLAVIAINSWNRLAIPFRTPAGS